MFGSYANDMSLYHEFSYHWIVPCKSYRQNKLAGHNHAFSLRTNYLNSNLHHPIFKLHGLLGNHSSNHLHRSSLAWYICPFLIYDFWQSLLNNFNLHYKSAFQSLRKNYLSNHPNSGFHLPKLISLYRAFYLQAIIHYKQTHF